MPTIVPSGERRRATVWPQGSSRGGCSKTLQRILRMRRFLDSASADGLARGALTAGYADQAHLTREVRAPTGLTPGEIART